VASAWDVSGGGPARRLFDLTPRGEEYLGKWMVVMERMSRSLAKFVTDVKAVVIKIPEVT
jgi:DNA-binding PadR family transcriptional regulator